MTNSPPAAELLDSFLVIAQRGVPLHAQVQGALQDAIDLHFEDGQTFWTEMLLMERLGVSRNTVRRALDELTREGVLVANSTKNRVVRKTTGLTTVTLFHRRENSDFSIEVLQNLAHFCGERNCEFRPFFTRGGDPTSALLANFDLPPRNTGVVLFDKPERNLALHRVLSKRGYRTVVIDTYFPDFEGSYVGTDTVAAVEIGLRHLFDLGHRRITLMVNEPAHYETVKSKIAAFQQIMQAQNIEESRVHICESPRPHDSFETAYDSMAELWQHRPTAIFTVSDPGAWAALKWLAEQKIEVPREVSVLGFEGVRPSRYTHPALSTVAHPTADIARRAIELLWEQKSRQEFLPPHLIVRDSTGPARLLV